jgi:superfamily II DNA or RNA helicase
MSHKARIDSLYHNQKEKIDNDLKFDIEDGIGMIKTIFPYNIEGDEVYLPFAFANKTLKLKRPTRKSFSGYSMNLKFCGTLREEQKIIKQEAITHLNKTGSIMISLHVGGGKTVCSINLCCSIKLKTLIIVNKIVLMKQWESSILNFCTKAKVQRLTTKSKMNDECDFYIINAINVPKMGREFFRSIGTLVIDESHLIMAETLSRSLQYIHPRYLIGLSATPYRPDGLDALFDLYFGEYKIIRELWHEHVVYKVSTGFEPEMKYTKKGKVIWTSVMKSQADNVPRNELIIDIIKTHPDRTFLVLVKHISQGKYLLKRLEEEEESVTSLLGSNQIYDKTARILIGTSGKIGTGFDDPRLDTLLLGASVVQYYIQTLGRIMRRKDVKPIVFDLVDSNPILYRHYKKREKVSIDHGGKIYTYQDRIIKS